MIQIPNLGEQFRWWVGVIESLDDPLAAHRAKVRIFGIHDKDTSQLSTNDLPWAVPIMPVTQARSTPDYRTGDWVFGFFFDPFAQAPMILGVFVGIPQKDSGG